ncbi:hypothetical protein FNV43_RR20523 [Rhamnella rubrinervis]|uniref:S-adenosylmethionine-dependent methyltransferase n=1 Tax=Rhamnella rubrinervis TaxID=2594499 RepID=A0A8K0E6N4_9ROSA|nr:hypothetical protein FNV43_RR20523 [Rhamnella rubrinervis]
MGLSEAFPMKGGDGPHSYAKNSTLQRNYLEVAKEVMKEAIAEKLDIGALNSPKTFCIADLGCSVGPNTFAAVEIIIEGVKTKYDQSQSLSSQIPQFQVFFNDHVSNDFNMLFTSLPQDKQYYAAGVPGSFYERLFPEASLHFVHSCSSLHWLSRVPEEVTNKNSPAWNKGRIHYGNSGDEVIRAYKAQRERDMDKFLQFRAQEVVHGGLMLVNCTFNHNGTHPSQCTCNLILDLLGSCLMDLARKGRISEEKVDSFNLPMYFMTPQEMEAAVERNGCFSIERMETLPSPRPGNGGNESLVHQMAARVRAGMEDVIPQHFGEDIMDEFLDLYRQKIREIFIPFVAKLAGGIEERLLLVLKRKY